MAGLSLHALKKRFGPIDILHGLDLDVADGEFIVLVGPSGCGKSTLLRMIAGLDTISDGELRIAGRRANDVAPQKRNIAMVFQSYALFPHMSVRDNILYGPKVRRDGADVMAARLERAAKILNLADYLDRKPSQLSGGQRQRVAMGRAIMREPDVFLFDEPLSNLDAKLRMQMRTEIKALHQALGTTIVYVTHDQIEAMTMADRIVVMNGGRIEQVGAPLELYDRPVNTFVAGFLGAPPMNLLAARTSPDGRLDVCGGVPLAGVHADLAPGREIIVGIRPERFRVSEAGAGLPFRVGVVEPTGSETHLFGTVEATEIRVVLSERISAVPGDMLPLAVRPTGLPSLRRGERRADRIGVGTMRAPARRPPPPPLLATVALATSPLATSGASGEPSHSLFDIIARIRMRAEDGSKAERRVAAFVLANAHLASTASIADIAGRCAVSEPTVTRFARSIGCAGIADFKFRLAQALAIGGIYINAEPLKPDAREARILQAVGEGARNAIARLCETTDMEAVTAAATRIAASRRILSFGSGGTSSMLARELENRLFRLGLEVRAEDDAAMQCMLASVAGPGTLVVAFSISGHAKGLVEAVRIARTYGAVAVAVAAAGSPLALAADHRLAIAHPEDGNIYKPSSGRFALLALVDILAMATAEIIGPRMLEGIRRIKQSLNTHIVADPSLPVGD